MRKSRRAHEPVTGGDATLAVAPRRMPDAGLLRADRRLWVADLAPLLVAPDEALWRAHSDALNTALFARWLPARRCRSLLKTDLYDEAMGGGLFDMLAARAQRVVGIDVTAQVLARAAARHAPLIAVAADVRHLPFASESFDIVVSTSTLDHFRTRGEILMALEGLYRVLAPGGQLLLTLDNPNNPAVALRNALPSGLLRRLGLVPYSSGATCGARSLAATLNRVGFEVLEKTAMLHCPRVVAVVCARRIERAGMPAKRARFLRRLERWEGLNRLPTRFLTGYYVGVHARKP